MTQIPESQADHTKRHTRAQEIFLKLTPEYQELIRDALKEERDVMFLKKRTEIHKNLYEIVKRVIK